MGKSPKFMVIHLKELIYTMVFILLAIVLIISLVMMFSNDSKKSNSDSEKTDNKIYNPGVYTSGVTFNGNPMEITVTVDSSHINSISMNNASDYVTSMYPLVKPVFNNIATQILKTQSLEDISFDSDSKYTSGIIFNEISSILKSARFS